MVEHEQRPDNINQGEGDKNAARRYAEATRNFVESGEVEESVENAADQNPAEAREAERKGSEHAKEEDPQVHRDYCKPAEQ